MNAYNLEATMCGAFIGLADYVQSPQAAFSMARLAAEHGEIYHFFLYAFPHAYGFREYADVNVKVSMHPI